MTPQHDDSIQQIFVAHRVYLKSTLFEAVPMTLAVLKKPPAPVVDMQVFVNFSPREEEQHLYEAVLTLQLTAKIDGNLLWRQQLQQAGLYTLSGFNEEQVKQILNGYCMNQLYPYACANVSAAAVQAGFPAIYLDPMNFDVLYEEQLKRETEAGKPG